MSYTQLFWNNSDKKITKSKKGGNKCLDAEIERKIDIHDSFPKNKEISVNMTNFRESIEVNLESRNNNRDIMEKRLNKREKLKNGWFNPFLLSTKYVDDLTNESNFLRPKNTYRENKKIDNEEIGKD
tara:strand:- start:6391 stop:6771 length:381 start_codon:yes stop_codon:yes gene_type:complete